MVIAKRTLHFFMMKRFFIALCCMVAGLMLNANPVDDLLERMDKGASKKFITQLKPSERDFFEIGQDGDKVAVSGNTWVNIAVGVNWYLKYHAGIHVAWNNPHPSLPDKLPEVKTPERHNTDLKLRYDFNYCTFSYSMAFWDWERWQQEIDWMALHGVNMPLAIVGEECVWRNMLLKLGYSEDEIGRFIAGPAFLAWWEMNNLEGWGGPLPLSWYDRQEKLQKQILNRMYELGMQPVLPGYAGMVPHDANKKLNLNVTDTKPWNGFQRPANLLPTDPRFDEIASLYYQELTNLFGKADYYSLDPFHESHDDAAIDYAASAKALLKAMKKANPKAVWVVQGWTENPRPQVMEAVDSSDMLVLDLFSECRPMWGAPSVWRRENGYADHPWLFCLLENFGANVGLHGRLDQLISNFYLTKSHPLAKNIKGIGFTMEGSENNPVMFELMSELPWRNERFRKEDWIRNYVKARYGNDDPKLQKAWQILAASIYNCPLGNNQQGPHESIFCARPAMNCFQASSWSKMKNYYDPEDTWRAAVLMNEVAEKYRGNNNFEYDLVDITRQALADQARIQYHRIIADYNAFSRQQFKKDTDRFLQMIDLQDELLGTRAEFRLGHWTETARRCGSNDDERSLYQWNAKVQITTWGNRYCADTGKLRDYAHKEWQGILSDFYKMRWHTYFSLMQNELEKGSLPDSLLVGEGYNSNKTADELMQMARPHDITIDYYAIEEPWTISPKTYSEQPIGSPIDIAAKVIRFLSSNN